MVRNIYQRRINHNSGNRSHPSRSLLFTEAMYITAIYSGVARKGTGAASTRRKKNTLKYTGNAGEWIHGRQTRPFDNIALYIANNRRRPCAPEALFSASSTYGHLGYTSECYTFRAACRRYAHTCSRFVNISWRRNELPVDDNVSSGRQVKSI